MPELRAVCSLLELRMDVSTRPEQAAEQQAGLWTVIVIYF